MPDTLAAALKKSKMLLLSITSPVLMVLALVVVPTPEMHLIGRLAPAGPMLFPVITLLLFPTMVVPTAGDVLNRMFPPAVPNGTVADPEMVQFRTVLFWAPLMKRIVLVPAVAL